MGRPVGAADTGRTWRKGRSERYIALENFDLLFDWTEVRDFVEMWEAGISFPDIAKKMKRHQIELAALLLDLGDAEKIQPRAGGLGGFI
ncbi:helix-turn-helix domain-containing protein [Ectobacillus antri]|uniref:helix-turn-helix domain-containing protein n=1 Tax=Ectobacillus antri TaxID=2486280 RepID=UPI001FECBF41|nr:helix-turn-helix domain-containing protein [Ectobacillus antri]